MTAILYRMDAISASRRLAQIVGDRSGIGMRLAAARIAAGLTNAELSRLTLMPTSQISQYENGTFRPGYEAIATLLPHLDVGFDYVLLGRFDGLAHTRVLALQNAWEQVVAALGDGRASGPLSTGKVVAD